MPNTQELDELGLRKHVESGHIQVGNSMAVDGFRVSGGFSAAGYLLNISAVALSHRYDVLIFFLSLLLPGHRSSVMISAAKKS